MTEYVLTMMTGVTGMTAAMAGAGGVGLVIAAAALVSSRRQKAAVARLEDRLTHLSAGVSLLANTTEDGLRGVAMEIARLAGAPEQKPRAQASARERIAAAAGHGRSVQDIAAAEQVSESEVLLHLLLDKLTPGQVNADVC